MAKLSHLLLHDPDPSGLDTLSYVFEKEGCKVVGTSDPAKVMGLVQAEGPPLVLVALREPEQAAIDLIREMTVNPRTRNVACMAIGPARWRGAAVQAGAFGLLASPVFLRDVLDASKLVAAATVPGSRPSPDTEVALKLSELGGVYYLIRALSAAGRSAAVELSKGSRRGELRFIDGELSSVQIGSLSGMAALHQALLWDEADLRLKFRNVVRRAGQLSLKSEELLEECDRFLRDFAHDVKDLGVAGTIYRPSSDARPTSSLPSEVVPLLRMFDGSRTLAQILEESPFRVFDTLRIVHQFAAAEAIRADAVPVPKRAATPPGPAPLAAWFQHAPASPARPQRVDDEDRPTPPPEPLAQRDLSGGGPRRPSAPLVPLSPPATARPAVGLGIPRAAKRTLTRREYPVRNPGETAPPVPVAARPALPAAADTPARALARAVPDADESLPATPPPVVSAAPPEERPRTPSSSIARGEIQVAVPLPLSKKLDKTSAPSVMVELGAVPQPRSPAPVIEAPLPVHHAAAASLAPPPPGPAGDGVPAPITPALVEAAPVPVKGPVLRKKTPVPGGGEPAHRTRTPSTGFSAMEADFFDREADLYKRESVETFDDLEGGTGAQRGSVRKT
jgi:ActR/RegA family two-component response regulator